MRTSDALHAKYGAELVRPPLLDVASPHLLRKALAKRAPPVHVTEQVCRSWFSRYRVPATGVSVTNLQELEDGYGDAIRLVASQHPTAYRLAKALRGWNPPLCITEPLCKRWLETYSRGLTYVHSAGHLELLYGQRIREDTVAKACDSAALAQWLATSVSVVVPVRICQTWTNLY